MKQPPSNLNDLLDTSEFQARFQQLIRDEARKHHAAITYQTEAGVLVKEYPATGEIYALTFNPRTLTLLSVHGVPVAQLPAL